MLGSKLAVARIARPTAAYRARLPAAAGKGKRARSRRLPSVARAEQRDSRSVERAVKERIDAECAVALNGRGELAVTDQGAAGRGAQPKYALSAIPSPFVSVFDSVVQLGKAASGVPSPLES